ncbi:hypothetical protein QYE76_069349 [Lolium multiflorum]|uniref:Transposase (putative) gypsy type domain-containing protein n=1 Tax=Lolium multiflorum TaxID=4521 RepID=A0AAD8WET4_LOLMU|nr:hypothetical protein QYE76_069349 [Lolium multiflorum]
MSPLFFFFFFFFNFVKIELQIGHGGERGGKGMRSCSVELWELIVHGHREPQDPTRLTSTEFYNRQLNASARDKIRSGINRKLLDQVDDIVSAKELWDRIIVLQEGTDFIQSALYETAKQEAHQFMIRDGESVSDAYARLGALRVRVKGLGVEKYNDGFEMNEAFIKSKVIAMIAVKQEDTNLALNLQIMTKSADLNSDDLVSYVADKTANPAPLLMPPRRLTRHSTPESSMAAADLGAAEWERSKISLQDINLLKKLGISKKSKALFFPSEESYPTPPMGYRVFFVDHLIRGLSAPIHPFLRGLLFVYGLQLHHLTPNSILHISIFITLCEAFLGVQPNWALWKHIFFYRRNGSPNVAYNIGGVVISVRPTVDYFDVKLPDSVQGWRKIGCTFRRKTMDVRRTTFLLFMAPKKSFAAVPGTRRPPKKKGRRQNP